MIINPQAKKILCFGDSLTWGNHFDGNRFPIQERWTYLLQQKLGESFDIIEEGLRARTTNVDDPSRWGRNGFEYFCPCFDSTCPDIIVLLLGTNDVKVKFQRTAGDILNSLKKYIEYTHQNSKDVQIILVSPPKIKIPALREDSSFTEESNNKLTELAELEKTYCEENGIDFVDLHAKLVGNTHDGVHLEKDDNILISDLIFQKISYAQAQ